MVVTVALLHVFSFHLLCYSGIYLLWCYSQILIVRISSVKVVVSVRSEKPIYILHHISQKFPQRCLWNGSNVHLIDNGPLASFQGRSSSAYSFHASLLQAIDGVISLALCHQVVSQASQHFRSSKKQATCEGCCAHQSICSVIFFHSGMSRAVHPQEFLKVDDTINTFQSGLPIPLFTFCSKLIESVRMTEYLILE